MKDENKTKEEFVKELEKARQRIVELETSEAERNRTEEELRKSEASLANAQRVAHFGNWDYDVATNKLYWSDEIYRIFGLQPHEFGATYEAFLNSVHPDDREDVKHSVNKALYEHTAYDIDHRIVLPSGEVRFVHEQGEVTFDEHDKPIRMVGTVQDITERKKAEKKLKASEEKYRTLTENINVGIYRNTPGPKGKFIEANPAIVEMFVYDKKKDLLKFNVSDLYQNPEDRKKFSEKIMKDGFVRNEEIRLKKKDGTPFWGSVTAVAIYDEKGTIKYYDGMIDDITKRKEMEEELQKSYEETKKALERERKFIESTAHYFRNPILIASGYLEIELEREISEEDRKNIEGIKRGIERLHRTVENVIKRGEIHD